MNSVTLLLLFFLLLYPSLALSQTSWLESSLPKITPPEDSKLLIRHYQRLASPLHQNSSNYTIEGRFANAGKLAFNLDYAHDLRGRWSATNSNFAYSIGSLYLGQSRPRVKWSFGRKVLPWNPTEAYWGMSQLNGQEGFTPLDPKQEGLIGFHAEQHEGNLKGEIFASYLFLPRLNPSYSVDDQYLLRSTTEWGGLPPQSMRLNDGIAPIRYTMNRPSTEEIFRDIIINPSFGISLSQSYQIGDVRMALRTYGIYKPENSLRFVSRNFYRTDTQDNYVDSTLSPFVHYHTLWGVALSQQLDNFTWDIHAARNRTQTSDDYESGISRNFFELHEIYYPSVNMTSSLSYRDGPWSVGLHYYYSSQSDFYRKSTTSLSKIPLWHRTWGFAARYSNQTWKGLFDIKYDTIMYNTILKSELSYRFPLGLSLGMRAEFIQSPITSLYNFWRIYRTNDSLQTYLSYNF